MTLIKRKFLPEIQKHLSAKEITMIVGPRQVGKTTLMEQLKKGADKKGFRTFWFNLDYETDKIFFKSQSIHLGWLFSF